MSINGIYAWTDSQDKIGTKYDSDPSKKGGNYTSAFFFFNVISAFMSQKKHLAEVFTAFC